MAEPTLALTFEDFIIRVAEYLGVASYAGGTAAIPTDAHNLEVCKRIVNDGWRRFYNSNPQWNWTLVTFEIVFDPDGTTDRVVNAEAWRYYMPDGFYGHLIGTLTYSPDDAHIEIEQVSEQQIRQERASGEVTGYPTEYALRPLGGDDKRRWEAIFYPTPSSELTVVGRCRLYPNKLVELGDLPNAGFQFDEAILAACMAEAERQKEDGGTVMEAQWAEALTRAVSVDQKTAPARLGDYGGKPRTTFRAYTGVDSYYSGGVDSNGNALGTQFSF